MNPRPNSPDLRGSGRRVFDSPGVPPAGSGVPPGPPGHRTAAPLEDAARGDVCMVLRGSQSTAGETCTPPQHMPCLFSHGRRMHPAFSLRAPSLRLRVPPCRLRRPPCKVRARACAVCLQSFTLPVPACGHLPPAVAVRRPPCACRLPRAACEGRRAVCQPARAVCQRCSAVCCQCRAACQPL